MSTPQIQPSFQIREFRRVPVHWPLYFIHEGRYGAGTAWNLSTGGWRIDSDVPLPTGAVLKLFVMLPDVPPGIIVEQVVLCWSRGQEVGVAIRVIARQDATRLQHFIAKSL
jgi:hypothetical protein